MTVAEKIQQYVDRLPAPFQAEVLDFVEYLLSRSERRESNGWSQLSLALAMRAMEGEDTPYTPADLKVLFA
jgi:hypothetical protein